jgi:hypothetical protein
MSRYEVVVSHTDNPTSVGVAVVHNSIKSVEEIECQCGCLFCPKRGKKYTYRTDEEEAFHRCEERWKSWKADARQRWKEHFDEWDRDGYDEELIDSNAENVIKTYIARGIFPRTDNLGERLYAQLVAKKSETTPSEEKTLGMLYE